MSKKKKYGAAEPLVGIAERINKEAKAENENFAFDPFTIIAIINVIIGLIRIIMECRKNREEAKGMIRKPGIIAKYIMKREIRKSFPASERRCVYNAMLKVCSNLTDAELHSGFDYVEKELKNK